jgi:hypothetical protein
VPTINEDPGDARVFSLLGLARKRAAVLPADDRSSPSPFVGCVPRARSMRVRLRRSTQQARPVRQCAHWIVVMTSLINRYKI